MTEIVDNIVDSIIADVMYVKRSLPAYYLRFVKLRVGEEATALEGVRLLRQAEATTEIPAFALLAYYSLFFPLRDFTQLVKIQFADADREEDTYTTLPHAQMMKVQPIGTETPETPETPEAPEAPETVESAYRGIEQDRENYSLDKYLLFCMSIRNVAFDRDGAPKIYEELRSLRDKPSQREKMRAKRMLGSYSQHLAQYKHMDIKSLTYNSDKLPGFVSCYGG